MLSSKTKKTGKVKFYNSEKGFGFIFCDQDKKDYFFHITTINGGNPPKTGENVKFLVKENKGRETAYDIDISLDVKPKRALQGFPCVRGESINGFTVVKVISNLRTGYFDTANQAKTELIRQATIFEANAIINYLWHENKNFSVDGNTMFWAEGKAVKLKPME